MKTQFAAVVLSLGLSSVALAKTEMYKIDTGKSKVTWLGKKVVGQHNGHLMLKSGDVTMKNGMPAMGSFVMDMKTIVSEDMKPGEMKQKLEGHLKSKDFFNVQKHPTGMFKITKVEKTGKKNEFKFTGDLTIKNITKPVTFPAMVEMKGGKAMAKAQFEINRIDWDIKYNSGKFFDPKKLGDKLIYDNITVGFDVVAMKNGMKKKAMKKSE